MISEFSLFLVKIAQKKNNWTHIFYTIEICLLIGFSWKHIFMSINVVRSLWDWRPEQKTCFLSRKILNLHGFFIIPKLETEFSAKLFSCAITFVKINRDVYEACVA